MQWLQRNKTSPMTGEALENTTLIPNHLVRGQIIDWKEKIGH